MIDGFVLASSTPNNHPAALEKIQEYFPDHVKEVHTTTGRYNLFLRIQARDADEMSAFVFETLNEMKDIQKTRVFFPSRTETRAAMEAEAAAQPEEEAIA